MSPALTPPQTVAEAPAPPKQQIGTAHMNADGTIVMQLRMMSGPAVGDSRKTYALGSPDYAKVLAHLPDLRTKAEVPVYNDWD